MEATPLPLYTDLFFMVAFILFASKLAARAQDPWVSHTRTLTG